MYRILGIASDGTMKLIKNEAITHGGNDNNGKHQWHNKSAETDCTGDTCEWPNSTLYNGINGDYYLTNTSTYMANGWSDKIQMVSWKYGDVKESASDPYNAETAYSKENAWTDTVNAKIGLMYIYDYYYANGWDGNQSYTNANNKTVKYNTDGWIYRSHSDGNVPNGFEWLLSRYGLNSAGSYPAWYVSPDGYVYDHRLNGAFSVRPVFYLSNNVLITNASDASAGSLTNPYMIGN